MATAIPLNAVAAETSSLPYADYQHEWQALPAEKIPSIAPPAGYTTYWFSWTRELITGKYAIVIDEPANYQYIGLSQYGSSFSNVEWTSEYLIFDWVDEKTNQFLQMNGNPVASYVPVKIYILVEVEKGYGLAGDVFRGVYQWIFDIGVWLKDWFAEYMYSGGAPTVLGAGLISLCAFGAIGFLFKKIIGG